MGCIGDAPAWMEPGLRYCWWEGGLLGPPVRGRALNKGLKKGKTLRKLGEEEGEQRGKEVSVQSSSWSDGRCLLPGASGAGGACTGAGALIRHPEMCLIFYLLEKNLFPFPASLKKRKE